MVEQGALALVQTRSLWRCIPYMRRVPRYPQDPLRYQPWRGLRDVFLGNALPFAVGFENLELGLLHLS